MNISIMSFLEARDFYYGATPANASISKPQLATTEANRSPVFEGNSRDLSRICLLKLLVSPNIIDVLNLPFSFRQLVI